MTTLFFRLNEQTVRELNAIEAAVIALARKLETLAPQEFARVKPIFDEFFDVLPRVRDNMIMVDAEENSEQHALLQ